LVVAAAPSDSRLDDPGMLRHIPRHCLTRRLAIALCFAQLGAGTLTATTVTSFGPIKVYLLKESLEPAR
jgi:hypothetical protein